MLKLLKNKNRNYVLLAQIVNAIIALLSGKLIAIYIVPEDFGIYNIQFATYTFFATLLIGPFIKFIKATNKTLLPKIGSNPYIITVVVLVTTAYFALISFLHFYYYLTDMALMVIILFFVIFSAINNILGNYLNVYNKLIAFSKLNVLVSLSSLAFLGAFFFLGFSFVKDYQLLWLMQLFGILIGLIFFITQYKFFKSTFKIAYTSFIKKYYQFAGPLMFLALWAWISNYFDRYAIEYFLSMKEVGIYNASYGVGSKFFLLLSPIFMVLITPLVYDVVKKEKKKKTINKYAFYYVIIAIPILAIVYFLKDLIGNLLLSESYNEGFHIIFWIALAYFILTLSYLFESLFYSEQKTSIILIANIISAIINVVLNIVLIPLYGIVGATIATCLGFAIHFLIIYLNFKKP